MTTARFTSPPLSLLRAATERVPYVGPKANDRPAAVVVLIDVTRLVPA
jgi:hypothetical protein